ncbi:UxaA family hydrolase [Marinomonas sp. 2405UD68-3]|uniref:UxaA family hydrolase n=1 Tax=Marinomonas sp. 2405UD68-3 TaxID=3391835 RepID=UPI0039C908F5
MAHQLLRIHPDDNVIVALQDFQKGEVIVLDGESYVMAEKVKAKHKFAIRGFSVGDAVIQYGITVGEVIHPIAKGRVLTVENTRHSSQSYGQDVDSYEWKKPDVSPWEGKTFKGVKRQDGRIGTANYWIVVPLVFCQNRNIERMKIALQDALGYRNETHHIDLARGLVSQYQNGDLLEKNDDVIGVGEETIELDKPPIFPNVDGVKFLTHTAGCGGTREDALSFCKLLAGYIHHPNVAGATILSLGCQNAQMSLLQSELTKLDPDGVTPVQWYEQQAYGQEKRMLDAAIKSTFKGLIDANKAVREDVPLSALKIGVECGGSDGFSGLSANPLIGRVVDKVVALGGASILGEFPELCGVEQNILNRCTRPELRIRFSQLMKAYEAHALAVGATFDMNPSPGNIRDGLITDAMKSAGAALKGGAAPVEDVLDYTEVVTRAGLNLLCTPGNDVESTTALVGSGANLVLFSTGLGTPTGNPIVPVMKISSNTAVAEKMHDIIDFNAGPIVTGERGLEELSNELLDLCIAAASGDYLVKSRRLEQDDFIPWKRGVSL